MGIMKYLKIKALAMYLNTFENWCSQSLVPTNPDALRWRLVMWVSFLKMMVKIKSWNNIKTKHRLEENSFGWIQLT